MRTGIQLLQKFWKHTKQWLRNCHNYRTPTRNGIGVFFLLTHHFISGIFHTVHSSGRGPRKTQVSLLHQRYIRMQLSYPPDTALCDMCGGHEVECHVCEGRRHVSKHSPHARRCAGDQCFKVVPSDAVFTLYCTIRCKFTNE